LPPRGGVDDEDGVTGVVGVVGIDLLPSPAASATLHQRSMKKTEHHHHSCRVLVLTLFLLVSVYFATSASSAYELT
jgi:hypothetical protein